MTSLANGIQWGSSPVITASFEYEHRRSGQDMQYRVKVTISPLTSSGSYFGYPIYSQISLAGSVVDSQTLKAASPSTWSSAITHTTSWFTVSNKTSGTTALAIRIYSGSGSSRDQTYTYSLAVDPAKSDVAANNGYAGSPLTVSITRYSTSFTHTLKYSIGSASGTIVSKTSATSVSWTPALSLCNQMPSSQQGTCTITCETYSGTTLVGSTTTTLQLNVPKAVQLAPQTGWATVSAYNTGTAAAGMSVFVQGYSKAQVTFDASKISTANSYGATPKSYKVVFDGVTISASPYRTGLINRSGTLKITCYVTDTRDRTTSSTLSFTVHQYTAPVLSGISVFRCNSSGAASESGTYFSVKATATYSSLGGANSSTLRVRYGKSGGSMGAYTNLTSGQALVLGGGNILTSSTYAVEISLVDGLGKGAVYTDYLSTEKVFFQGLDGGGGAAFGKRPEKANVLDVAWDLQTRGDLYVGEAGHKVADFVIEEGSTGAWRYRKWNKGRIELWSNQAIESGALNGSNGLYHSDTISLTLPFALGTENSVAFVSAHGSAGIWAMAVNIQEKSLRFTIGRMYGDTTSLSMTVQIYVSGYLA